MPFEIDKFSSQNTAQTHTNIERRVWWSIGASNNELDLCFQLGSRMVRGRQDGRYPTQVWIGSTPIILLLFKFHTCNKELLELGIRNIRLVLVL